MASLTVSSDRLVQVKNSTDTIYRRSRSISHGAEEMVEGKGVVTASGGTLTLPLGGVGEPTYIDIKSDQVIDVQLTQNAANVSWIDIKHVVVEFSQVTADYQPSAIVLTNNTATNANVEYLIAGDSTS